MPEAVIELGSNLGNREENLKRAIDSIDLLPGTCVKKVSRYYETEPFGVPDKQDNYINCCVQISTELLPETLLGCCLGIEAAMGRVRTYKNAARIIDVDLLLYENANRLTTDLTLPHARIKERAFVMVPLKDIYPNMIALGVDFSKEFSNIDCSGVVLYK